MKNNLMRNRRGRPLWEGHRERLRRRMEQEGWDALKPYEMVELVLYHAVPRQDLSGISRMLVDRFETVGGVFGASREQLLEVPGMTATLAEWIGLTGDLVRAYRDVHLAPGIRLSCCQEVIDHLRTYPIKKGDRDHWVLYADFNFNLLTWCDRWESETWWDSANVRRMILDAIGNGAKYLYLVLWNRDGADGLDHTEEACLEAIVTSLGAADLELVDCFLVNGGDVYSMRLNGRMKPSGTSPGRSRLHERYVEIEEI